MIEQDEQVFLNCIVQQQSPGDVVLDIGAASGAYSKAVKELFSDPQLHLFEAREEEFRGLVKRFGKDSVNALAVSDETGSSDFTIGHNREHSHLGDIAAEGEEVRKVPTVTVDEYCAVNDIEEIFLLKIDTEGGELKVLKGAEGMLTQGRVKNMQFEYGGTWYSLDRKLTEICEWLESIGYSCYDVKGSHLEAFKPIDDLQFRNVFVLRNEMH